MSQILNFSASTSVKNLFGRGLVTDQIAAVFELVKNSYDADAKEVDIIFTDLHTTNPTLTISDDGTGMNLDDIENKWMIIGTDSKKHAIFSPIFRRPLNGDKGIGRFSVDRLGTTLYLEAQKRGSIEKYRVKFNWSLFDGDERNINEIDIPYKVLTGKKGERGVSLCITGLRDVWDRPKIKELYRNLRHFKSPFSQDDNFKMYITAPEFNYYRREVTVENLEGISSLFMSAEITEENPGMIHIAVNKDGLEYESTQTNPYSFGSVNAKMFFFNQGDKIRFANRYSQRVREYGNIRLYRDDFRVYPYGEADNDWLDIDRRLTQGWMRHFGTRDLIGYVQISKEKNANLKPLTNRQGLESNEDFEQLREFVIEICVKTLESYYFNAKKSGNETIKKTKAEIGDAVTGIEKLVAEIKLENPDAAKQIKDYATTIKKQQQNQLQYIKDQQELVKVYSRIAQKETFLHQLIHQAMMHVNNANVAIDNMAGDLSTAANVDDKMKNEFGLIKACVTDALTLLKTVRDDVVKKRNKTMNNVESLVIKYINEGKLFFSESDVTVSLKTNGDMNYYADSGDITAILNNLGSNAVKSLREVSDRPRKLDFELYRTDRFFIIKCIDNGVGVNEINREKIFDPFHTTTDGFGLGLTIIDEIAKEYNGALELITTDNQVGACFSVKLRC